MNSSTEGYHVGIILDGNGRWATDRKLPRLAGHNEGRKNVHRIVEGCPQNNVSVLTIYAFAVANWTRDADEVKGLWNIFRTFFSVEMKAIMKLDTKITMIGDRNGIPGDILELIDTAIESSKNNKTLHLQVALNYDGVDEVVRATKAIVQEVEAGSLTTDQVTVEEFANHLDTKGVPNPDVVIRTGLPQVEAESGMAVWRSSSFLQLQSAQAVCVSTPVLWPDFSSHDLQAALQLAKPKDRLFGGQRN